MLSNRTATALPPARLTGWRRIFVRKPKPIKPVWSITWATRRRDGDPNEFYAWGSASSEEMAADFLRKAQGDIELHQCRSTSSGRVWHEENLGPLPDSLEDRWDWLLGVVETYRQYESSFTLHSQRRMYGSERALGLEFETRHRHEDRSCPQCKQRMWFRWNVKLFRCGRCEIEVA